MAQIWYCCGCGCRPVAEALIWLLPWETPYAAEAALKREREKKNSSFPTSLSSSVLIIIYVVYCQPWVMSVWQYKHIHIYRFDIKYEITIVLFHINEEIQAIIRLWNTLCEYSKLYLDIQARPNIIKVFLWSSFQH